MSTLRLKDKFAGHWYLCGLLFDQLGSQIVSTTDNWNSLKVIASGSALSFGVVAMPNVPPPNAQPYLPQVGKVRVLEIECVFFDSIQNGSPFMTSSLTISGSTGSLAWPNWSDPARTINANITTNQSGVVTITPAAGLVLTQSVNLTQVGSTAVNPAVATVLSLNQSPVGANAFVAGTGQVTNLTSSQGAGTLPLYTSSGLVLGGAVYTAPAVNLTLTGFATSSVVTGGVLGSGTVTPSAATTPLVIGSSTATGVMTGANLSASKVAVSLYKSNYSKATNSYTVHDPLNLPNDALFDYEDLVIDSYLPPIAPVDGYTSRKWSVSLKEPLTLVEGEALIVTVSFASLLGGFLLVTPFIRALIADLD